MRTLQQSLIALGRFYIAFSLGGVVVSYQLFGWIMEHDAVVAFAEGLVLWLTLALPPYILAHALCVLLARLRERLRPRPRIYVQGRSVRA